jgi:hypothetical protein
VSPAAAKRTLALAGVALLAALVSLALAAPDRNHGKTLPKPVGTWYPALYISYGGHKVLTQVIDRGPSAPGREFNVTKALADEIGLHGTKRIRWSYAR